MKGKNELRRCVHIVKSARPECTGICRIVLDLAKLTGPLGYETSVLFLEEGPRVAIAQKESISASSIAWSGHPSDLRGAWQLWRWLRKQPVDVVHFHHGGRAARAISRLAGTRAVVRHVHWNSQRIRECFGGRHRGRGRGDCHCSQAVADGIRGCRAEVIYAGVAMGSEPPPAAPVTGPLRIGVLSRLIPLKNVEAVIEAAAALTREGIAVEVEIAGSGPSEAQLRALAARLGVNELVRFLGWRTDTRELLASWNLLAIPSLDEGFPVATLEAMAAARPIVASETGGLCEQVVDGVTGRFFPRGNADALVRSIAELAGDREGLVAIGVEGWKRAREHFSVDATARKTTELYDRLLDRGPRNSP